MNTAAEIEARDRFISVYLELQQQHGFMDQEFLEQIGYKSKSFINDIIQKRAFPSFDLLVGLKTLFQETDINRIFTGPPTEVFRHRQTKWRGSPLVLGWRVEKLEKNLAALKAQLTTAARQDHPLLMQQIQEAHAELEAFKKKATPLFSASSRQMPPVLVY